MNESRQARRRKLVLRNSVVEVLGYGATQALRLGSNLIVTRLLVPEAFGLMAIVNIVLFGVTMLSDVGIIQAVIQNKRGDDEDFLNTAWTLQIIRGGILCVATWVIAYPASLVYDEPQLFWLLLAAGLQLVIAGFESTSLFTLRRRVASLRLGHHRDRSTARDRRRPGLHCTRMAFRLGAADRRDDGWDRPTRLESLDRHRIPQPIRRGMRAPARRSRVSVAGSSGAASQRFSAPRATVCLLGRLLGMSTLGVYTIALFLSEAIGAAVSRIVSNVFYPIFSRVGHEEPDQLREEYYHSRLRLDLAALPALGVLAMLGDFVVQLPLGCSLCRGGLDAASALHSRGVLVRDAAV